MSKRHSEQLNIAPLVSPVANAVRHQIRSNRRQLLATALLTSAIAMPQQAAAQSDSQGMVIEEIVVTAQKREQKA